MDCRKRMYARMRSLHLYQFPKKEKSLVECELESYLSVLEPLMEELARLKKDVFIAQCGEERLAEFERLLAIPVNHEIPTQKRREIAQSKMAIGVNDFCREGLERALNAIGIKAKVEETPGGGNIIVTAKEMADNTMTLDQAKQAFNALMPAHLTAEFVTGGLSYQEFDSFDKTFAELDQMDKNWSQLEMMGMEEWQEVQNV